MKIPDISVAIETKRITLKLGFAPSEFLGATTDAWKDSAIIYKTLFDWIRSKAWHLSAQEIEDIESAIRDKLPNYRPTNFKSNQPSNPYVRCQVWRASVIGGWLVHKVVDRD
jgi:hypothetical protein